MSAKLINLNPDLQQLQNEGYCIEIRNGHLLVHDVPYVTSTKEITTGTLVSVLTLTSPEKTGPPNDHVCYFIGDHPHKKDGAKLQSIANSSQALLLTEDLSVNHTFSAKPEVPYPDYYKKMTTYANIISAEAAAINPKWSAMTFRVIESEQKDNVLTLLDTNANRSRIASLNTRMHGKRVAIIGLGGTGSYVLDLLSKMPLAAIHCFDGDDFLQHNAFRAPGAASVDELKAGYKKVHYYLHRYGQFHKGIVAHAYYITEDNLEELSGFDFVFICIDKPSVKRFLFRALVDLGIPFVDAGMDVERGEGGLIAMLRVTSANPKKHDHLSSRVSFADDDENHEYRQNIQLAELNMMNAAMAVIRWKRMIGFYTDLEQEFHSLYSINAAQLTNHEVTS